MPGFAIFAGPWWVPVLWIVIVPLVILAVIVVVDIVTHARRPSRSCVK